MFFLNGVFLLLHLCVLVTVNAQLSGQLQFAVKSGTCPTDICVSVFDNGCTSDLTCPGDFKCCSNNCGKNMCYPPKAHAPQQEQPLHVSFVQNGGMEFNNHCYYNSKWYSAGQNLISRNGDVCTCVNRDKITCSRSNNNNVNNNNQQSNNFNGNRNNFNTQYNNNANNGQRFQQNSPVQQQANFRMGPDTWQSSWTTKAPPTTTTQREATPHPAKIFIQNINHNQVMNGLGSNQQANGQMYNSLGDHKMTQTPAFFHASPVKEAQANGVINGHVNFHDPFEPASTHAHQSLFDKGFPSIANKPLYVQEHKTESSGPYKPIMDGNVNFGLPSKQAGNVWAGPLTTEISVMQEVGSPGGSHQGQSVAQEYNPWGVTQTYENTGFSQNVVENIELGLLESQTQGFVASSDFNAAFFGGQEQPQDISNPSNQNNRQVKSQSLGQFQQQIAMPPTNINQNFNQQSMGSSFQTSNVNYQNNPSVINNGMGHGSESHMYQPADQRNSQSSFQMHNVDNQNVNPQSVFGSSNQYDNQYQGTHTSNVRMQEMGNPFQQPAARNPYPLPVQQNPYPQPVQQNPYPQPVQQNPYPQHVQQTFAEQQPWSNQRAENANQQWAPKHQISANGPAIFQHDQSQISNVQQRIGSGNIQNLSKQPTMNNIWDNAEEANQHNNKNKADKFSIIPNPNENLSQGSQFTFGNGRSQAKVRNVISFEALQSQSDLRRFNSKLARTQFSLSDAQGVQPTQIETPIPPTTKIVEKTTAKPIETTETPKTKTKSDIDIQPAVDEIVIETTIPPKTSTQSFIQFLQFVLEQRELVKSKADAKASETIDTSDFVKSKTAAPTTKISVKAETVAPTTKLPVKSSSSAPITSSQSTSTAAPTTQKLTTVVQSTTTVPTTSTAAITTTAAKPTTEKITTAVPETTTKARTTTVKTTVVTAAPTVASTEAATQAASTTTSSVTPAATTAATVITTTAASKMNSIEPTTSVNLSKIPSTLRSLLADIDKQTTVRIKFKKSNDATPEISIEYVTPSPKKDEKPSLKQVATSTIPTTTFKYGPNNAAQKLSFKNPIPIESKESRIKIVTETPPPKVVTSTENPGSTQAGVPDEKSGGLTNSHFSHYQFTDSSPVRMDVVDYSKDIPLNAKQTTTAVPAETPGVYNGNSTNFGPGNIAKQNSPPKTSNRQQEEEALPANATFFQKIMFLKRQKAARENPVEALQKFGDPSANMLNLIKLLPKNNNSPMAATNEAALFTSKVEPPVRKTTSRDTATTPAPKKSPKVVHRNVPAKTNTRVKTPSGNMRTNSRSNSRNTAQRRGSKNVPVTPKGRRPQSNKKKPQPKRNKNQCIYFGKVYRAGQRFKNDKGQKCKCQRGGRVKCRR
uniref:WAP domain-containing protein n=1 Tax=Magallana gigas TaxID=29159 RepID=A0A8W8NSP6_MAGGI|nr:GATA zinc finger domain-containing protein 7 isoform X2 [Crassostrea gigas]